MICDLMRGKTALAANKVKLKLCKAVYFKFVPQAGLVTISASNQINTCSVDIMQTVQQQTHHCRSIGKSEDLYP